MKRISGIWENSYIQELGITDHIQEVAVLKNRVRELKATHNTNALGLLVKAKECLDRETMDLFLILEKWADDKPELREQRFKRFEEKGKENIGTQL